MDTLFTNILNMSISASYLIIAVIVIRLLLRKAPKNMRCFLWLLVGIRLIFPFSIESVFSLIPSTQVINETVYYDD
jgi:beta-lactamase regulating signal transducer with metallopeptidase domain